MNYIEKIVSDISRIKEMVEKWNGANDIAEIERKIVKDYLSRVYDKICRLRVDEKQEKEQAKVHDIVQKTVQEKPVEVPKTEPVLEKKQKIEPIKIELSNTNTNQESHVTLAESLQKTKRFLSDDFEEKDDVLLTPIENLARGIGLNDKFLFSKELFGGNSQKFNATVNAINEMNSFEEAEEYINTNFSWSQNNVVKHFMNLVRRRFLDSK